MAGSDGRPGGELAASASEIVSALVSDDLSAFASKHSVEPDTAFKIHKLKAEVREAVKPVFAYGKGSGPEVSCTRSR
jgi:hypothetical protein